MGIVAYISGMRVDRTIAQLLRERGHLADIKDVATPFAMVQLLRILDSGTALSSQSRAYLLGLMRQCRTGTRRIRGLLRRERWWRTRPGRSMASPTMSGSSHARRPPRRDRRLRAGRAGSPARHRGSVPHDLRTVLPTAFATRLPSSCGCGDRPRYDCRSGAEGWRTYHGTQMKSPCISICRFDGRTGWCVACARTLPECREWKKGAASPAAGHQQGAAGAAGQTGCTRHPRGRGCVTIPA